MNRTCRSCPRRKGVKQLEVELRRGDIARWFLVQVCAECEQVLEAMLEYAAVQHMWQLPGMPGTRE